MSPSPVPPPEQPVRKRNEMKTHVQAIPEGFHTLTPHLVVKGASAAIEFYKQAFGAQELGRLMGSDGTSIMHAQIKIGDSIVFLVDEFPQMGCKGPLSIGGTAVTLHLYVADVDTAFQRAVAAGAQVRMPVSDMFWGDRYGRVADPFGHEWSLATHQEDLTPRQISERAQGACSGGAA